MRQKRGQRVHRILPSSSLCHQRASLMGEISRFSESQASRCWHYFSTRLWYSAFHDSDKWIKRNAPHRAQGKRYRMLKELLSELFWHGGRVGARSSERLSLLRLR